MGRRGLVMSQQALSELPEYEYSVNERDVAARQRLNSAMLHDHDQKGHGPEVGLGRATPARPKDLLLWVFMAVSDVHDAAAHRKKVFPAARCSVAGTKSRGTISKSSKYLD